jgi:pimeloyl-ACP methyl ester carboxylesterase
MPGAVAPPAFDRLESIAVPTFAVNGQSDDPDMLAIGDAVERRVPGARRLLIPNAGHLVNLEQPAAVNEALVAFLTAHR